jgi:hypothetical protein
MGATASAGVFARGDGLIGGEVGSWRGSAPPNHPAKGRGAFGGVWGGPLQRGERLNAEAHQHRKRGRGKAKQHGGEPTRKTIKSTQTETCFISDPQKEITAFLIRTKSKFTF